jgi:transcriptional regulator GlxA family with amidase domain
MGLTPTTTLEALGQAEGAVGVAVIPGAIAINAVCDDDSVRAAVATLVERAELVTSVCTGAFLLADQGLLAEIDWTTHFEDVEALAARTDTATGHTAVGWVDADSVITSGGLSSGLAMALHVVDRLAGRELAVATAAQLEYRWDADGGHAAPPQG